MSITQTLADKHHFFTRMTSIMLVLCLVLADVGMSPEVRAAEVPLAQSCDLPSLRLTMLGPDYPQSRVMLIQQYLAQIGPFPLIDGLVGPRTLGALQPFCLHTDMVFTDPAVGESVEEVLASFIAMTQAYPDWQAALLRLEFADWLAGQSINDQAWMSLSSVLDVFNQAVVYYRYYTFYNGIFPGRFVAPVAPVVPLVIEDSDGITSYYMLTQSDLDVLRNQNALEPEADLYIKALQTGFRNVAYPNVHLFERAVHNAMGTDAETEAAAGSDILNQAVWNRILDQARKTVSRERPVQLRGDGCGCVRDHTGTVYGFYPAWMAGVATPPRVVAPEEDVLDRAQALLEDTRAWFEPDSQADIQRIDFSAYDRVAYFALPLDEGGINESSMTDWKTRNFINEAHKYLSKVDLVVYTDAWRQWNQKEDIKAAYDEIDRVMQVPVDAGEEIDAIDGLIMYFGGHPETAAQSNNITLLMEMLESRGKMKKANERYDVSLMLDVKLHDEAGIRATSELLDDLKCIILGSVQSDGKTRPGCTPLGNEVPGKGALKNLLVFLEQDTAETKKILRRTVEETFSGQDRVTVLRMLTPVIMPTDRASAENPGVPYSQLVDDFVYFDDNFDAVGIWPIPLDGSAGENKINEGIALEFSWSTADQEFLIDLSEKKFSRICDIYCPARIIGRTGALLIALTIAGYLLACIWYYRPRKLLVEHPKTVLSFVALFVVLPLAIMVICDPAFNRNGVQIILGMLVLLALYQLIRFFGVAKGVFSRDGY